LGIVVQIFTAAARGAPMEMRERVTALADEGLVGDRYSIAKNRRGPDYQLTLIEIENIDAFLQATDPTFTNDLPRRNIVTRDIALNDLCGKRFRVGAVVLEGLELSEPCSLFAKRTRREVLKGFLHRGGLRARILEGGEVRVGAIVQADASQ
jgi:MOSC domain-containing protein YiiM